MNKVKNNNGALNYWSLLMYDDNVLSIGEYEDGLIKILEHFFRLMEGNLGHPDRYLGENVESIQNTYSQVLWSMKCWKYMKNYMEKVKKLSEEYTETFQKRGECKRSMLKYYQLDLDVPNKVEDQNMNHNLIGILRWEYELV